MMKSNTSRQFFLTLSIVLTASMVLIALIRLKAMSRAEAETGLSNEPLDSAYQAAKDDGSYEIEVIPELMLHDAQRNKDLSVKISFPKAKGVYPVILFSHGAGSSSAGYAPLTRFWATHGYVVIQPTHADSIALRREQGENARLRDVIEGSELNDPQAWQNRVRDLTFIMDNFNELERRVPDLQGKMDTKRIGVGGHSYGAYTSQLIGGATVSVTGTSRPQSFRDDRPRAIMLLSPQGRNAQGLTETSWQQMTRPMISMTGTLDSGLGGQPYEWRLDPFNFSPAGDKYQVLIEGANHLSFTGGLAEGPLTGRLIARRNTRLTGGADQRTIFDEVKMASLAFWDAYLKDDRRAKDYLKSEALVTFSKGSLKLSRK